ncbi:hypothetical protein GCM10027614_61570 [Micromonospora vulcania]
MDRSRPRALPATVRRVADALRAGRSVAVYPEGTTWCAGDDATDCRPGGGFRPAMFQAAIDTGSPVVPLRLRYRCEATGATTTAAAFLGADTLLRSVARVVAARELVVSVTIAAALHPARDADRRLLARAAESAVHLVPSTGAVPRTRLHAVPTLTSAAGPAVVAPTTDAGRDLDLAA